MTAPPTPCPKPAPYALELRVGRRQDVAFACAEHLRDIAEEGLMEGARVTVAWTLDNTIRCEHGRNKT